jgi:dolichyl-phosphate-mannose--protein O-mannosyl transferase
LVLGDILGPAPIVRAPGGARFLISSERHTLSLLVVCLYMGVVVANFIWLWPILTGLPITVGNWQNHLWLPSWRWN